MKSNVNEILSLIESLSIEEKKYIYKQMEKDINSRLSEIFDRVNERAEKEPLSLKEITEEVERVKGNWKAEGLRLSAFIIKLGFMLRFIES